MTRRGALASFLCNQVGGTAVEFALVAPTFLMFVFLILDGGRMLFTKQALKQLTSETVRCYALKASTCADEASTTTWAIGRGALKDNLRIVAADITVSNSATCFTRPGMAKVTISVPWKKGDMGFLPQSLAPTNLVATSCFPIATPAS